jgi:hypothetical protein
LCTGRMLGETGGIDNLHARLAFDTRSTPMPSVRLASSRAPLVPFLRIVLCAPASCDARHWIPHSANGSLPKVNASCIDALGFTSEI